MQNECKKRNESQTCENYKFGKKIVIENDEYLDEHQISGIENDVTNV